VLREGATAPSDADEDDDDALRLVHRRRIGARRPGWEVFKLRNVIQRWANDPSTNRGVLFNWLIFSDVRYMSLSVLLSVTFVRLSQAIEIFCNVSTPFGTFAI